MTLIWTMRVIGLFVDSMEHIGFSKFCSPIMRKRACSHRCPAFSSSEESESGDSTTKEIDDMNSDSDDSSSEESDDMDNESNSSEVQSNLK